MIPITGRHPQTGEDVVVTMTESDPFSAYVFKTTIDPFMGRLSYLKVQSGSLDADSHFYNSVGKGSYVMEFSGYEQAPREVIAKVVEEHKALK